MKNVLKTLEVDLGTSRAAAGCRSCGRVFTSVTAFDMHQRFSRGGLVCLLPSAVGLEKKPNGQWGRKLDERQRVRLAGFNNRRAAAKRAIDSLVSPVGSAC